MFVQNSTMVVIYVSTRSIWRGNEWSSAYYISRALKNNRSIVKLEMGENLFGPKTCRILAESMLVNDVVRFIDLGSNPLTIENDINGIESMTEMLKKNQTLRHLSFWRCNIGVEGGKLLSSAILLNNALTCFELGAK